MRETLSLGQDIFGACDIDVLEYRVTEVRETAEGMFYTLRSKRSVGQHRSIEIMIYENKEGNLRYFQLVDTEKEDCEYGLAPFVDCQYFRTLVDAKKHFAKNQVGLINSKIAELNRTLADYRSRKQRWETILRGEELSA